ncbi:type III polyketide synthase [Pseudomonas aeruginosa]|uniref:type III polyketide synthase n=1 Tax=Pseudomonas aeruginosa TaxID=287 RepID=UPI0028DCCC2C|nr:type III polyketide synthase [Pseudomonas aeruginosa]WNP71089.1 type III polyketide synthase [Pseudomonas aeruginosa]HBN9524531.1 type III polyketide synthase [Pseudomonas aeruginosa]HBP1137321.1 type III polyketide synthase [Pseudomonas aeruginosa]
MTTICSPVLAFPEHIVRQEEMISQIVALHHANPKIKIAERMIRNTTVQKRSMVLPLEEIVRHTGVTHRNTIYEREARRLATGVAEKAIVKAGLSSQDIDMVIVTSCTGFMMPSLTAHLVNSLGLRSSTVQLPIAQLGCVAGASAINRAFEFCGFYKTANVLIVCVEFSSLCFQPDDDALHSFISAALFGDAASACVVRGDDASSGFRVLEKSNLILPGTEHYIRYDVKSTGYHFQLDKDVMHSIQYVAPYLENLNARGVGQPCKDNDFFVFHTGGRRILDELVRSLGLKESDVQDSRDSLADGGNTASVVVFDVLRRKFEEGVVEGAKGILAAFGPGFTAEMCVGVWQ